MGCEVGESLLGDHNVWLERDDGVAHVGNALLLCLEEGSPGMGKQREWREFVNKCVGIWQRKALNVDVLGWQQSAECGMSPKVGEEIIRYQDMGRI